MEQQKYTRLPGRGRSKNRLFTVVMVVSRLWLGEDHLLAVESHGFAEEYKRFYFKDIQGFVLRRTAYYMVWNIILTIIFAGFLSGGIALHAGTGIEAGVLLYVIAGFFGIGEIINLLLGPSCVCHIQTAVQIEELPSIGRLRTAMKVMAIVRPVIEQSQRGVETPPETDPETKDNIT